MTHDEYDDMIKHDVRARRIAPRVDWLTPHACDMLDAMNALPVERALRDAFHAGHTCDATCPDDERARAYTRQRAHDDTTWRCTVCGVINPPAFDACVVCGRA